MRQWASLREAASGPGPNPALPRMGGSSNFRPYHPPPHPVRFTPPMWRLFAKGGENHPLPASFPPTLSPCATRKSSTSWRRREGGSLGEDALHPGLLLAGCSERCCEDPRTSGLAPAGPQPACHFLPSDFRQARKKSKNRKRTDSWSSTRASWKEEETEALAESEFNPACPYCFLRVPGSCGFWQ